MKRLFTLVIFSAIIFFAPFFFRHQLLYFSDNLTLFFPLRHLISQIYLSGNFPLWNSYLFSGTPLFADITIGAFSPFMIIYLLFSTPQAITISAITSLTLIALGTYLFSRQLKLNQSQSIFTALIFAFSGTTLFYTGNIVILETLSWIPIIFYSVSHALDSNQKRSVFLASIFIALQIFSGHLPLVLITFIALILFSLKNFKKFKTLFSIFILSLLISAIQLLPTIELFFHSTRVQTTNFLITGYFSLIRIPQLILAQFYGVQNLGTSWGFNAPLETGLASTNGYLGIIPLLLSLITLSKKKYLFPFLAIISLIFALGPQTPAYQLLRTIPGYNLIRAPNLWLIIYSLFIALAAAQGLKYITRINFKKNNLLAVSFFLTVLSIIFYYLQTNPGDLLSLINNYFNLPSFYSAQKTHIIITQILSNLFIVSIIIALAVLTLLLKSKKLLTKSQLIFIIIFLCLFDLFSLGRGNLFFAPLSVFQSQSSTSEWLNQHLKSNRFLSTTGIIPFTGMSTDFDHIVARKPFSNADLTNQDLVDFNFIQTKTKQLLHNLGLPLNLPTANGYAGIVLKSYANFWDPNALSINQVSINSFDSNKLALAGIKYLLIDNNQTPTINNLLNQGWFIIYQNQHTILENLTPAPIYYLEPNPGSIQLLSQNSNQLTFKINSPKTNLIIKNNYYPGWTAQINNQKYPVTPYHNTFQQISLPSGEKTVTLNFKPKSFSLGLLISLSTVALLALNLVKSTQVT